MFEARCQSGGAVVRCFSLLPLPRLDIHPFSRLASSRRPRVQHGIFDLFPNAVSANLSRFDFVRLAQGIDAEEFTQLCQDEYKRAKDEGVVASLLAAQTARSARPLELEARDVETLRQEHDREQKLRSAQTAVLTDIFRLVDEDRSGRVDKREMLAALQNDRVRAFAAQSPALSPLLGDLQDGSLFHETFKLMDVDNDEGVSLEEFVEFCLMAGRVRALNNVGPAA